MVEGLDSVLEHAASFQREKAEGQFNLFQAECAPGSENGSDAPILDLVEWDDLTKLSFEKEMIGFYITGHPLMKFDDLINKYSTATSKTVAGVGGSSPVKMAGLVKKIKEINTRKGDRMAFVTLEDLEGVIDVTVFADLYSQVRELLHSGELVFISGVREGGKENPKGLAQDMCPLQ